MTHAGVFEHYDPATGTTTIYVPRPAPAAPLTAPAAPVTPVAPAAPVVLPAGYARIDTVVHEHYARLPDGHLLPILPPGAQPLGAYGSIAAPAPAAPLVRDVTPHAQAAAPAQLPAPVAVPQARAALARDAMPRLPRLTLPHGMLVGLFLLFVLPLIPGTLWLPDVQLWALRSLWAQTRPMPYPAWLATRAVTPRAAGDPAELTYRYPPTITAATFCQELALVQSSAQPECQTIYADLVLRGMEPALALAEMDVKTGSGTRGAGQLPPDSGRNLFLLEPARCDGVPPCAPASYDSYRAGVWAWTTMLWRDGTRTLTDSLLLAPCTRDRQDGAACVQTVAQQMTLAVRRIRAAAVGAGALTHGADAAATAPLVAGDLTVQVQDVARATAATTLTMQLVNTGAPPLALDSAALFMITTADQTLTEAPGTAFSIAPDGAQLYILTVPIGVSIPFTLTVTTQTGRAEAQYAATVAP